MLYLHCGWPKTGTTTLQAALCDHRSLLAGAGVVYPERWMGGQRLAHHGLFGLLRPSPGRDAAVEDFKRFLTDNDDRGVVLSAEGLTNWIAYDDRRDALLAWLEAAQEVVPTRVVLTLRRYDGAWCSLYSHGLRQGLELPTPAECVSTGSTSCDVGQWADSVRLDSLFEGMRIVEDAVGGDVVYVRYDSGGAHNRELLDALGVPAPAAAAIAQDLERGPRLNVSLTHKQAAVLLNLDALSARAGVELDGAELREAFARGDVGFSEDRRCELLDAGARASLHERALAAARGSGFAPYIELFADAELGGPPPSLDPEIITDEDLGRLVARLRPMATR